MPRVARDTSVYRTSASAPVWKPLLAVALSVVFAPAATVAAQSYEPSFGQSFTVPTGPNTMLLRVSTLPIGSILGGPGAGTYTARLYAFSGIALVGSSLWAQSLGASFSGLDLSPNIGLTAGGTYALVVNQVPGAGFGLNAQLGDPSPGGNALICDRAGVCTAPLGTNSVAGFTAVFGPTTVPEPATWALIGAGLLVLGRVERRRATRV